MILIALIHLITKIDLRAAMAEGKLRLLYVDAEPGRRSEPRLAFENVFLTEVRDASTVNDAMNLLVAEPFDLVLYPKNALETSDLCKLNQACQESDTTLLPWNTQAEELGSDERIKAVFRDALIGIYRTTPDGRVLMANPALVQMLGYGSYQELKERNIETDPIYADRDRKELLAEIDEKGSVVGKESAWRRQDGSTFFVQETARAVKGPDGTTLYYEGTVQDITEKRMAEEALRESKEKFQALVESIGDFIWELDPRGRYVYASPQIELILGYRPEEIIGRTPSDTVLEEDVMATMLIFMDRFLQKQRFTNIVSRHRHKDGRVVYVETNAVPVLGHHGELTGYRGIDRDVTPRMVMEKALQAANDNLSLLNSITRHDVSNQLTIINGYLDLLGKMVQDEMGTAYLAKARKATSSIRRQIEFSKDYQDMGKREPRFQVVGDVVMSATAGLDLGHISLTVNTKGLEVFADPMLEKVFRNLMDNSVRHGGSVRSISVDWRLEGEGAVISYQDDGVGIADDERPLLFVKGHGKNTGLGLFLSKAILAITNISIAAMPSERGARFDIRIPSGMFRRKES